LWLVVVAGLRGGEPCGLQIRDIDLDRSGARCRVAKFRKAPG
jgi:integrase